MRQNKLTIILFAAVQLLTLNFVAAQSPTPATSVLASPIHAPPFGKPSLSETLASILSLTDVQRAQIQVYIDTVEPELDAIQLQARQAEDGLMKQLHAQIRSFLSTEQQTKLDVLEMFPAGVLPPSRGPAAY